MLASRKFGASAAFSWLSVETSPRPVPKVMLVAVPCAVAPIVRVWPSRMLTLVVAAVRPSAVRALAVPAITRSSFVPVLIWSPPVALTVEGTVVPVIASIAARISPTVPVVTSMSSVPAVAEPVVPPPLLKLMMVPLMVSVSAITRSVASESLFAPPASKVASVMATGTVKLFSMVVPVTVEAVPEMRSLAVAPVIAVEVTEDFCEYDTALCSAWLATDLALSISFCSEVMPVLAACSTCTPLPMPSSRLLMSLARGVERSRREVVGRVVEGGVDLLAGGKAALGGRQQVRGGLQRQQVLPNRRGKNDIRHFLGLLDSRCRLPHPAGAIQRVDFVYVLGGGS